MRKISNKRNLIFIFLLISIFVFASFVSAYTQSYYSSKYNNAMGQGIFSGAQSLKIDESMCQQGTDFLIQITPLSCSPTVVRSDLLAEENVNVFCKMTGIQLNPFVDIASIDSIRFEKEYPREVLSIGYMPAQAALGYIDENLEGSLILNNLGYVVITLRKQPNESALLNCEKRALGGEICWVSGNITANLRYDVQNSFGVGNSLFYLPEMDDNRWQDEYVSYNFWDGKGYLRATAVDENSASIAVYSDNSILRGTLTGERKYTLAKYSSNINLKVGETSNKIFLPGISPCLASLQLKLEGIEDPDTRARLKINEEYIEVGEDEQFLDSRCTVVDLSKKGLAQEVKIRCREEKANTFTLRIFPEVNLSVNGEKDSYKVGQFLYQSSDGKKSVYLGYVGSRGGDESDLENLYITLVALPVKKDFLDDSEISSVMSHSEAKMTSKEAGKSFFDKNSDLWKKFAANSLSVGKYVIKGESFEFVQYQDSNDGSIFCWNCIPSTVSFQDGIVSLNGFSNGNYMDDLVTGEIYAENYENAMNDFETVIDSYSNEVEKANDPQTFGERALKEEIDLAYAVGEGRTMLELCRRFAQDYPETFETLELCSNLLKISNSEISVRQVNINNIVSEISFEGIREPSIEEYSARLFVQGPLSSQYYDLRKNKQILLSELRAEEDTKKLEGVEYVMLESLEVEEASIKVSVGNLAASDNFILTSKNLKKGESQKVGDYTFTVVDIKLKKVAKVSVKANTDFARSNSSFNFKIGVEKRAIQLSPEKAKQKIMEQNKSIESWEKASNALNGVVKTMKAACIATGAVLTAKNLIANRDGKAIARQEVMGGTDGWNEKCADLVKLGDYKSVDACLLANSEKIEENVDDYFKVIRTQNGILSDLNKKYSGTTLTKEYSANISRTLNSLSLTPEQKESLKINEVTNAINSDYLMGKDAFSIEQLREIQLYSLYLKENPNDPVAMSRLNSVLADVRINSERYILQENLANDIGVDPTKIIYIQTDKTIEKYTYTGTTKGNTNTKLPDMPSDTPIAVVQTDLGNYIFVLDKSVGTSNYPIKEIYTTDGILVNPSSANYDKLMDKYVFVKYDKFSYQNTYKSSYGDSEPMLRYFESSSYKCRPSIVPLDKKNGWYVGIKSPLTSYDESGVLRSFYLCNVGEDGIEEFQLEDFGGDNCRLFYTDNREQNFNVFSGLGPEEAEKLYILATNSVERAQDACMRGLAGKKYVSINGERITIGAPPAYNSGEKCTDFMSVKDCNLLFNVCDPVICPSSRCNLGGSYPVTNVIQTGIVGSIALCYPNAKWNGGDVYVPFCLSGIAAGIDNWISIKKAYVDCLQTSIDEGETVGICDEINSIYTCEFFWKQSIPVIKLMIPKLLEKITGQSSQGGGEYKGISTALQNAKETIDYFKQYYAEDSYRAFQVRSTEEVGTEICGTFISAIYPDQGSFLDNLITPDSPEQFTGKFEEISLTTATNPPTSQYKVWYHIYAGKDSGAHYTVFLRGSEGSYFQDTAQRRMVASGYIERGGFADEAVDFTAPSGYQKLCIMVNGREECGFKEVSTSFAVNRLSDLYLKQQSTETEIKTEKECISGTTSLYSLLDLNAQSAAENLIDPTLYAQGIIRICSTDDPGIGTDREVGREDARWKKVGYCGTKALGCWIDTDSVKDAIKSLDLEGEALSDITEKTLGDLSEDYFTVEDFEIKKKEVEGANATFRIDLINSIFELNQVFFNYQKAYLFFWRGKAYAELAIAGSVKYKEEHPQNEEGTGEDEYNLPETQFNAKYLSPYFLLNDKNILTLDDRCYRYFNSKWQFAVSCDPTVPWYDVRSLDKEYTNPVSKKTREVVTALQDKDGDYFGGLTILIDKTLEDNNAELSDETFKATTMNEEREFTVKFKDVTYEPMKTIYYRYENNQWFWSLDDKFIGGGIWQYASNHAPGFSDEQEFIVSVLEESNLYEGAALLFDYSSEDIKELYGVEGEEPISSLEDSLQRRDLTKLTTLMTSLSSSVFASSFKCYCGSDCDDYAGWLGEYSQAYNIPDELLLLAIMIHESTCRSVESSNGQDIGLMQINSGNCGFYSLPSDKTTCKNQLLNDKELNIKVGVQVLKDKYNTYNGGRTFSCPPIVKTYSGWEAALRGYNGWGCTGDDNYVENVKSKYFELINLYNGKSTPTGGTVTPDIIDEEDLSDDFSDLEKEVIINSISCLDCGKGLTNFCDEEECKAIGVKLGKECIYTDTFTSGKCEEKIVTPSTPTCTDTCVSLGYQCGTQTVCAKSVNCGTCTTGQTCSSLGKCITSTTPTTPTCTDTCVSLGYQCGTQTVCAKSVNCGTCSTGQTCNSLGKCITSSTTIPTGIRAKIIDEARALSGIPFIKYDQLSSAQRAEIDKSQDIWTWKGVQIVRDYDNSGSIYPNCFDSVLHLYNSAEVQFASFAYCLRDGIVDIDKDGCNKNTDITKDNVEPGDILSIRYYSENHNVVFLRWIDKDAGRAEVFDWIGRADKSEFPSDWTGLNRAFRSFEVVLYFNENSVDYVVYAVGKPIL